MVKIIKYLSKNYPYIFIFVFFLYLNFLFPQIGDDWEVATWFSQSANGNILILLKSIYWNWKNFNGRGLSLLLTSFFCYYKFLWNFVSAGMFTSIVYLFGDLLDFKKNKIALTFLILFLLSVSGNIRIETYSLVCANIGFVLPLLLILIYLKIIKKDLLNLDKNINYKRNFIFFISIFCLIISTLMENISAGFTFSLAILNIYTFLKNKKINYLFIFSFISSLIGSIFMFTSPGMHAGREVYNNSLGLLGTINLSLPLNIGLTIFENNFIFFIISLFALITIFNKSIYISNKILNFCYLIFISFSSLLLFTSIINQYLSIPNLIIPIYLFFFLPGIFGSIYWLIFLLSFIIPISFIKTNKNIFILIYLIAIFSFIPASLITQTGARIISITVFCFMAIGCGIFNHLKFSSTISKLIFWPIIFGIFVQANILLVIYLDIYQTQKIRQKIIDNTIVLQHQQLWNYQQELFIPSFKQNSLYHTANPTLDNTYHYNNFIRYNRLDPETKVIFK